MVRVTAPHGGHLCPGLPVAAARVHLENFCPPIRTRSRQPTGCHGATTLTLEDGR